MTFPPNIPLLFNVSHFILFLNIRSVEQITIPSQRRYVQYFSNILDGVRPRSEPLLLRRVIMNTIPTFGNDDCSYIYSTYIHSFNDNV